MSFGLSPTGFKVKRQSDILASLQASVRALLPGIGVEADQVMGQLLGVFSDPLAELWSLMLAVYSSQYRQGAEGVSLDGVAAFVGLNREAATASTVPLALQGDEGTLVPAGKLVQVQNSGPVFATATARIITQSNVVHVEFTATAAAGSGEHYGCVIAGVDCGLDSSSAKTAAEMAIDVAAFIVDQGIDGVSAIADGVLVVVKAVDGKTGFPVTASDNLSVSRIWSPVLGIAEDLGPSTVPAGTVTDIVTAVTGWESVENLVDGASGSAEESDPALRQRIILNPKSGGRATEARIKARLLDEVPGMVQVNVISNRTGSPVSGRPGHSFEVIVQSPGNDDDVIAQEILDNAPAGIEIVSTSTTPSSGNAVDSEGKVVAIAFSRQEDVDIWLWIDLTYNTEENFPPDGFAQVRAALLALGALSVVGGDIIIQKFYKAIYSVPGIATATIYLALSNVKPGSPATNTVLGDYQLAVYDSTRVVVEDA